MIEADRRTVLDALTAELDIRRQAEVDRTRTTETKAGLLLVPAGLFLSVIFSELLFSSWWVAGIIPAVFGLGAVGAAIVAAWPRMTPAPNASPVYKNTLDEASATAAIEYLHEVRLREIEARKVVNTSRQKALSAGFVLVVATALIFFVVVVTIAAMS